MALSPSYIHHSSFIIAEAQTTLATGVVNKYQPVSAVAGSTITLTGTATGATHTFAAGDRVLLVQMTGLTSANGGKFEFVTLAAGTTASSLVTTTPITRAYTPATEKVQAIWVPYDATSITVPAGGISALKWNGTTGGIVAILTPGTLTLNGPINADGAGFRYADGTNTINGTDIYYGGGGANGAGGGAGAGGGYGTPGNLGASLIITIGSFNGGAAAYKSTPYTGGGGGGAGVGGAGSGGAAGPHGGGAGGGAGYAGGGNGGAAGDTGPSGGLGSIGAIGDTDGQSTPLGGFSYYGGAQYTGSGGGGNRYIGGGAGTLDPDRLNNFGLSGTHGGRGGRSEGSGNGGDGGGITPVSYNQYQYCDGSFNCPDPRIWMAGGGQNTTQGGGIVLVNAANIVANTKIISANGDAGTTIYPEKPSSGGGGGGGGGLLVINTQSITAGPLSLCAKGGQGAAGLSGDGQHGGGGGGSGGGGLVWVQDPLGGVGRNNATGTAPAIANMTFCIDGGASSIAASNPKSATFTGTGGAGGNGAVMANNPCGVFGAEACVVVPPCTKPKAAINSKTQTMCEGGTAKAMTATPSTVVTYAWYGPLADTTSTLGTAIASATTATYTPTGTFTVGTKYYAVITTDGACSDTAFAALTVIAKPAVVKLCANEKYMLTAEAGATAIQWYKNGVAVTDSTKSTFVVSAIGSYSYSAIKANSDMCRDSLCCPVVFEACVLGSLGDYVWKDSNNDGIQNGTEAGVAGVQIELYKNGVLFAKDTTDATGKYLFSNLDAGTYKIKVLTASIPAGCTISTKQDVLTGGGTDATDSDVNASTGFSGDYIIDPIGSPATKDVLTVDAGLYSPKGSLGDYVWKDSNNDGIQNGTEAGVAGVQIELYKNGVLFAKDTTDATGKYLFSNLDAGTYKIKVLTASIPAGCTISTKQDQLTGGGTDATDSDVNASTGFSGDYIIDPVGSPATKDVLTVDAGLYSPKGSLGDYVWKDSNNDGIQNGTEAGVAGVQIELYKNGVLFAKDTTDANGKYLFSNLDAGTYKIKVLTASIPAGCTISTKQDVLTGGGTDATDSDVNASTGFSGDYIIDPIGSPATKDVLTVDAGLAVPSIFDLAIRKDLIGTGPYKPGDNVTFNVTVFNQGNVSAYNVEVSDYIPTGMSLNDATWTVAGANATKMLAGPIAANSSIQVPITLKIDAGFTGTNLTNVVEITKADDDTNTGNTPPTDKDSTPGNKVPGEDDIDQEPIPLQPTPPASPVFDLALTKKVVGSGPYRVGDLVSFEISVLNQGSVAAYNVEVSDYIPTGLTLSDATWTMSGANAVKTIAGPIAVGGSAVTTITMKIDAAFTGTKITNVAEITKGDDDTNPNNTPPTDKDSTPGNKVPTEDDQDTDIIELTPVLPPATPVFDLAVVKKHTGATPYMVGDTVTYSLAIINQGNVAAYNVELSDYIPSGMTLADATWTAAGANATKTVAGPIAAGTTQMTTIKLRISPTFTGTSIKNVVEISKADDDTNAGNTPPVDKDGALDNNPANNGVEKDDVTNEDNKTNPAVDDLDSSDPDVIDVKPAPKGSIGDYVFLDNDKSNTQTVGDVPVKDVVVYLLNASGTKIDSTKTGIDGKYLFSNLPLATYTVQFVAPAGQSFVTPLTGGDPTKDSDAGGSAGSPTYGKSAPVTLTAATPDVMTVDAGLKPVVDVSCVQAPATSALGPNVDACKGKTYPALQAIIVGTGTVDWYKTATGGSALATGTLTYTPAGNVAANDTFYLAARSTLPITSNCPTDLPRTRVIVVAKNCIDTVDLALKKTIDKKIVQIGDVVTYTIKVWNQSKNNATGVEVTDTLNYALSYISSVASRGSYNATTKAWTIGNVGATSTSSPTVGDTVTLTIKAKVLMEGLWFNTAEVSKVTEKDKDSTPGNSIDGEDDLDRACFTVPFKLCANDGSRVEASVPSNYTNVKWSDGQTGNVVRLSAAGTYTFTASNGACPSGGCCPIIIEAINCCPANICVPFTITKRRL
jgi:uncharacterized repeat protein (TIGR01451 family)